MPEKLWMKQKAENLRESTVEEREMLRRLRGRDRDALADLSRMFGFELSRAAFLFLQDGQAAEDAVQDVLVAAWDGAKRTSEQTPVRSWLFGILFNCCRKQVRRAVRNRRRERRVAAGRDRHLDGPVKDLLERERTVSVKRALGNLEEHLRFVLILRFERDFSVAETAAALGIPEGTVKSRTHEGLRRLKTALGEDA
ncbi:MAG: RNA polymerase sigma factor [Planctomycetota bacterium]